MTSTQLKDLKLILTLRPITSTIYLPVIKIITQPQKLNNSIITLLYSNSQLNSTTVDSTKKPTTKKVFSNKSKTLSLTFKATLTLLPLTPHYLILIHILKIVIQTLKVMIQTLKVVIQTLTIKVVILSVLSTVMTVSTVSQININSYILLPRHIIQ